MTDTALLNTKEAAKYLGYSEGTLKVSRSRNGKLADMSPPKHIKVGPRTVRYLKSDLDAWIAQLSKG